MLELSRKIAVDFQSDADFHESWRSPVHGVLLLDNRSSTMEEPALEPVSMPHEKDGDPRAGNGSWGHQMVQVVIAGDDANLL